MAFSKKERELLEHWVDSDFDWLHKQFEDDNNLELHWKKQNYYRVLKSRINKKVKQMRKDLDLYHKLADRQIKWDLL